MWTPLPDSGCGLGESPFWHPGERSLYWVDIPGRALLRTRGEIDRHPVVERWPLPQEPGCIAPARSGGLVIALRDGIYRATTWGGSLALLAPAAHDTRTHRFNDGKCDPLGRFWAGTLNEAKDAPSAALYCLDPRRPGELRCMLDGATTANGLNFCADRRTLYWADTAAHAIRAWPWEAEPNLLGQPREFARFSPKPAGWTPGGALPYAGRPDGAALDAEGNDWSAMFEGAQLVCLSPAGERLRTLAVPAQCPTMPCFGGGDLRTLFVTTARKGRGEEELARWPWSGAVLWARVATAGVPVAFYNG